MTRTGVVTAVRRRSFDLVDENGDEGTVDRTDTHDLKVGHVIEFWHETHLGGLLQTVVWQLIGRAH